jgi:ribosomal protein S18 acetylase RimI-like enzyme
MPTRYRKFARADVAAAHRLSLEVGWPHRLEDWKFLQRLGTGHVALEDGEVVGTILTWKHDRANASLGMVIVKPDRQGRGIGRRLMRLALRDLTGRAVMLNATPAGQPLYEKLGFKPFDRVEQHQGNAAKVRVVPLAAGERLRPVGASDVARLVALATRAAGISRARLLRRLLESGEGIVLARADEVLGFAVLRRFGRGYAIGPVVAPDTERAQALASHWIAMHPGRFVRVDTYASSGLGRWLDSIGLPKVDTVITMVKGKPPTRGSDVHTFALVSHALG